MNRIVLKSRVGTNGILELTDLLDKCVNHEPEA